MIQVGGKTGTKSYPTVYINLLGVDKNNYKKGYGAQLVVAVIRMAKTIDVLAHIEVIQLHSLEDSVDFYKKLGFSEVREYYPGRVDGSKMYYNIDKLRKIDFLRVYMNPFSISDEINKMAL
jgi:N-acetylglutamate synthase-like GNAT family acetyltransferase